MATEKRTVVLLQPGYLPWAGFFEQVHRADLFVVFDDAQYTKLDWRNRNRIKAPNGKDAYLTVPIMRCPVDTKIRDVRISWDRNWAAKHLNMIKAYYGKAPFFGDYFPALEEHLNRKHTLLIDLLLEQLDLLNGMLGIRTEILLSSELKTDVYGKGRLLEACRELGATHCYNGMAGEALYDPAKFAKYGIKLIFQRYNCKEYPQQWPGGFISNLSIIDVLFNCGPSSPEYVVCCGEYMDSLFI